MHFISNYGEEIDPADLVAELVHVQGSLEP